MAIVPEYYVLEALNLIRNSLPANGLTAAKKIIAYFERTWIKGSFEFYLWNHSSTIGPRTNNHVEGFHSKLNRAIKSPHPYIFKLKNIFKRFEATYNVKYISSVHSTWPKRDQKYIKKDNKIEELLTKYYRFSTFIKISSAFDGTTKKK